jgi:putative photosynthetic complex assembly protein 2
VTFGPPAAFAAFVWWFTTGVIFVLDGLPRSTFRWSMTAATAALMGALYGLHWSATEVSGVGAYTAFSCAIVIWGWVEMSFLMGFITGPRKHACVEPCSRGRHFLHAAEAVIYNEIATLTGAAVVAATTWASPNRIALWTYLILWSLRLSAKLNLFLGVPNLGEQFLPPHLQYLKSFFRRRPMNALFPFSVGTSTTLAVLLAREQIAAQDIFQSTAYALLTTLVALGALEHWFMVLPLPSEKLWSWAFKRTSAAAAIRVRSIT